MRKIITDNRYSNKVQRLMMIKLILRKRSGRNRRKLSSTLTISLAIFEMSASNKAIQIKFLSEKDLIINTIAIIHSNKINSIHLSNIMANNNNIL